MDVPRPVSVLVFFVLLFLPVLCKGVHLLYHFGEKNWRLAIHNCFFRSCFFLHFVDLVDFVDLVGLGDLGDLGELGELGELGGLRGSGGLVDDLGGAFLICVPSNLTSLFFHDQSLIPRVVYRRSLIHRETPASRRHLIHPYPKQ